MKIDELYKAYKDSTGVCTDTRKLEQGNIFFSLKGENFNGNKYAEKAYNEGAKYCVVDEAQYQLNKNFILVEDVLTTLQILAQHHRQTIGLPILALTGSNGKTTTKELINTVLSEKYEVVATVGNLNNHIGVPLTLLAMNKSTEIGIVEMGANHLNEIKFLCNIAQPDYGLITNFGKAHIEGFGSIENIVIGKSELYDYLDSKQGKVFVNHFDSKQTERLEQYKNLEIANSEKDFEAIYLAQSQPLLKLGYNGDYINTNLTGSYNYNNILYAIAVGEYFQVSKSDIIKAIESYTPDNNRSQIIKKNSNTIILDAYNANPSSMIAALDNFGENDGEYKIAILGDMFELGHEAENEHQAIADYALRKNVNQVLLVGENFYKIETDSPAVKKFRTFEDLQSYINSTRIKDCYLLIKGSRGMALERSLDIL